MARRKKSAAPGSTGEPSICRATLGPHGSVVRGAAITRFEAEAERRAGRDVVVCGPDLATNRRLAEAIERAASGTARRCPPHANSGPNSLPHYQPDARPPAGHTFYETPNRKAVPEES